ncbi:DDB1- and CUL4-associated factor 17-like isoform X2 [Homarus americanus]|uniref:DDB1- and CUL4-associated factor 17-like isoform X2 n=1 Tax=Homarus americanus TaxID=6706 RepID=UPI001C43AA98|nr:DDB1- and CUL4-associated factor 17-like isoform X2 [Homarus americanus]
MELNVPGVSCGVMKRICGDGRLLPLYKMDLYSRPKELAIYEIPDPNFKASIPQQEYQPVMFTLCKGGVLMRHNLENGRLYNKIQLSHLPAGSLSVSFLSDVVIIKSPKLKFLPRTESLFRFSVFSMHPFKHLATLDIASSVFPDGEHKSQYGKLRNAEIHDDMLLVMTNKNFTLIYDAQKIIKEKMMGNVDTAEEFVSKCTMGVEKAPPLLFVTLAHMDILGLGACPWTYIRAVSDSVLEVRDLRTEELLEGGQVRWKDKNDVQISPDYLMFHPDDSSRVIHVRTSEIRFLAIRESGGKRRLEEEFIYPEKRKITKNEEPAKYSRSGRLLKTKFELDNSLNRAISFNIDADLRVLVILEAWRDIEHNCTKLLKVVFYDSLSYDLLHEMDICVKVDGDIETNRLSIHLDRDILNIVSNKGSQHTVLVYRLKEVIEEEENEMKRKMLTRLCNSISSDSNMERFHLRRRAFRRSGNTAVERPTHRRQNKRRRARTAGSDESSNESDDDDEWVP